MPSAARAQSATKTRRQPFAPTGGAPQLFSGDARAGVTLLPAARGASEPASPRVRPPAFQPPPTASRPPSAREPSQPPRQPPMIQHKNLSHIWAPSRANRVVVTSPRSGGASPRVAETTTQRGFGYAPSEMHGFNVFSRYGNPVAVAPPKMPNTFSPGPAYSPARLPSTIPRSQRADPLDAWRSPRQSKEADEWRPAIEGRLQSYGSMGNGRDSTANFGREEVWDSPRPFVTLPSGLVLPLAKYEAMCGR